MSKTKAATVHLALFNEDGSVRHHVERPAEPAHPVKEEFALFVAQEALDAEGLNQDLGYAKHKSRAYRGEAWPPAGYIEKDGKFVLEPQG